MPIHDSSDWNDDYSDGGDSARRVASGLRTKDRSAAEELIDAEGIRVEIGGAEVAVERL